LVLSRWSVYLNTFVCLVQVPLLGKRQTALLQESAVRNN